MRILLVEDDEMIGEGVVDGLKAEGYAVDWVQDGNSALIALRTTPFSLVILDLGLPGKDGISVLQEVRSQRMHVPVLVTTARDTVSDRVKGLDAGADDYLVKPFDLDELSARIRALLRRSAASPRLSAANSSSSRKPAKSFSAASRYCSPPRSMPFLWRLPTVRALCSRAASSKKSSTTGIPPWAPTPSKCTCIT